MTRKEKRKSLQPSKSLLESTLGNLFSSTALLCTLGWTSADIAIRIQEYSKLFDKANQTLVDLQKQGKTHQEAMDAYLDIIGRLRMESDLNDYKVQKTLEFLQTDEGMGVESSWKK